MRIDFKISQRVVLFVILLLVCLHPQPVVAHGLTPLPADPSPLIARGQDKQGFVQVVLRADRVVAPGEIVNLTLEAEPTLDAAALSIQWHLPDGGEFLNGTDHVTIPTVRSNEHVTFQRQLRFATAGVYAVTVSAGYTVGDSVTVSGAAVLYFRVEAGNTAVYHNDPRFKLANHRIIPTTVTLQDEVVAANANGDPCFRIDGVLTRLDRRAVPSGGPFVDSRVPVAHVPVDMMEEDTLFDDYYGTALTDAGGNFHFEFCDDDGIFDDELELYVVVRAEMWDDRGHKVVYVEDSSWIDETHEFESGVQESEGGSLRFDMKMDLNYNPADFSAGNAFQSQVFNIAEAVYNDWLFWNANGGIFFTDTAEVHFEPGYGDDGSYYQPFWNEITVADGPTDNDGWDDSVVMHEWNHFADDVYGCDDTPGGEHSIFQNTNDTELAFSEGYANYYQSVARQMAGDPNANFYFDINAAGGRFAVDFEPFIANNPTLNSVFNEGAIAGMLWDLQDGADPVNDGNDRVGYGVRPNQELFTDPAFESNGDLFDDTCNVYVWLKAWRDTGKPATRDTAAAVSQNIGYTPPGFDGVVAAGQTIQAAAADAMNVVPTGLATGYRWWKQLTWVVDTSTSMAGPKLDGAKTVINEQLNDLNNDPQGVDFNLYTFNHEGFANTKVFENEFYADRITGPINGLAATSSLDLDCGNVVYGLGAMKQALLNKRAGDLWLFTDGRDAQSPKVETVVQQLNKQQVKGSIALMGGCATPPVDPNKLNGAETYLGNAAGPQSSGIVPYLVTALRSGGRFLFVEPDQLAQASDILRAQLANSAGAGRWSDYVSDTPFYRWDKLDPNEYHWIDALDTAGGTYHGQPHNAAIAVNLPQPMTIWGKTTNVLWGNPDGYFLAGNALDAPTLDILYNNNLTWAFRDCGPRAAATDDDTTGNLSADAVTAPNADVPCFSNYIQLYSKQEGDWFAVSILGNAADGQFSKRDYQVLLNPATEEIRYQYNALAPSDSGGAEIAITDPATGKRLLVSNKDTNGARAGTGYKFYWAPPQPAKTFTVTVDALMEGVGFLLTGYSGDFEQMQVTDPDGTPVDCSDTANVLCLNLGKVQYIQANVNGRVGDWHAVVDAAAPSNQGTFSFISTAASTVGAEIITDRSLFSGANSRVTLRLGRATDDNLLTGWLQRPNGSRWGSEFVLYDDGLHDDLFAGDGYFGSDGFGPGNGAGYLWVRGTADGVPFVRADETMLTFQPFQMTTGQQEYSNDNDTPTAVTVELSNSDSVYHCYDYDISYPEQWAQWSGNWDYDDLGDYCLSAGETRTQVLTVYPAWFEADSGATGEVTIAFTDVDNPGVSDSVTVRFLRQRGPATLVIDNPYSTTYLRPNGSDSARLRAGVFDEQGFYVADGTTIQVQTDLGTVNPELIYTIGGLATFTYTTGTEEGDATITATSGSLSASTMLHLRNPLPDRIVLEATPNDLSNGGSTSALVATVYDRWGDPMANQTVRLGLSGDGGYGTIDSSEVMTITTDSNGQISATYTKAAGVLGSAAIAAELLYDKGSGLEEVHSARVGIYLGGGSNPNLSNRLYLPLIAR